MHPENQHLLQDLYDNRISVDDFLECADPALRVANAFVFKLIEDALQKDDPEALEGAICLVLRSEEPTAFIDTLNELMIRPQHRSHQMLVKMLQDHLPSPKSIPYIRQALASNFDYLEYTASDSDAIAKWFSWLLYAIGTEEAIEEMRAFSYAADEGIAQEMRYRLQKIAGYQGN